MPTATGEATATTESAGPMLGVNLREDRVLIGQSDLAKSVNADLHLTPGSIVLRLGRTAINGSALSDLKIRRQTLVNGVRFQVAGRYLYRDFVQQPNVLFSTALSTSFQAYLPQADTTLWTFIADGIFMAKDNGSGTVPWTIAAPTVTPVVAIGSGGSLTGSYSVRFTYCRKTSAGALAAESNPSSPSTSVALTADQLDISGLTASTDSQVTHIRIYRTPAGGSDYLFDQDITNGTTTATSTQSDTSLGAEFSLTDKSAPPFASMVTLWNETLWLTHDTVNTTYLYYSQRLNPENWPPANFLSIGDASDPLQTAVPYGGLLGVFARKTKYRILGNAVSGYSAEESMSRRGTAAYQAVIATEHGVIFPARDGIFATDFSSPDVELSQAIFPLFVGETVNGLDPINWDAANTMRAAFFKKRYYLAYPSGTHTDPDMVMVYSFSTKQWYFYDHPLSDLFYEEINNQLVGGGQNGISYVLENGSSDGGSAIALDCETKDFAGASKDVKKLFHFMRIDANTLGDTLTCKLYVDDVLKTTQTFSSSGRTEKLLTVAGGTIGYHWRIKFTYSGTSRIRIYPPAAVYVPLVSS